MQRYFIDNIENGLAILSKDQIHHIEKVVRMNLNEELTVVCDSKAYLCHVDSFNPLQVKVDELIEKKAELDNKITLFYCLPKGEKLELVLQKATELGVDEIVLVNSSRCIAKIKKEDEERKLIRFNKILLEASEQSQRTKVPTLNKIINFKDIVKYDFDHKYIAYEKSDDLSFYDSILKIKKNESISVVVGSEGGFSKEEVDYLVDKGYLSISLGNRILRSETSCLFVLSVLSFLLERDI